MLLHLISQLFVEQIMLFYVDSQESGQCLEDEPSQNDYNYPDLPPGAMYNAEHQCRLQFGFHSSGVCTPLEEV